MKKWILFLTILGAQVAIAATGEHAESGPVEIPRSVIYQCINVAILFFALVYLLKAAIVKFYADRKANYQAAAERAKAAREKAEQEFLAIQHKLHQLESSAEDSFKSAQAEAQNLRQQMIKDGQEMAARIKHEAEQTAKIEIQKAQQHLREQLLKDAVQAAKSTLSHDIGAAEHQKLQAEFVNNVQAVNP
jgi:F-type H+-transporting ATPase subunit b